MTITQVFHDGIQRVKAAPVILIGIFLTTLILALPQGLILRDMLRTHLGDSLAAEAVATGVNFNWWQEFSAQAKGLGATFSPTIIGFAAVLNNISDLLDNRSLTTAVAGITVIYLAVWTFLLGGTLDRYARNRPIRTAGFFAAAGIYFFRFLRLAIINLAIYAFMMGVVHSWLFDNLYEGWIRDLNEERTAFFLRTLLYVVFVSGLVICNIVLDYAKIRTVVEDRRSMIGATLAGFRFVVRHARRVIGLYFLNSLVFMGILASYAIFAPSVGGVGGSMWWGFLISQAYILARLWIKLVFLSSQTSLFQAELAHAGYTAAPLPIAPDSPAAEAIAGKTPRQ